jgi:hypothetical protein
VPEGVHGQEVPDELLVGVPADKIRWHIFSTYS